MTRSRFQRPRRHRSLRKLTPLQLQQFEIINEALDAGTEFGLETSSRERLLIRVGEMTAALRLLRGMIR